MTALALSPVTPSPFDPFLRSTEGAESVRELDAICRGLESMLHRDVLLASPDGVICVARCEGPLAFVVPAPGLRASVSAGDSLAISDHRGVQYVGFHAVVAQVERLDDGGARVTVLRPAEALFYPGRRHLRLDGALGAEVELGMEGRRTRATGVDVSMGGIGVRIPLDEGFVIGQIFTVHLDFGGARVALPARVRTALVVDGEIRLGLEFAGRSEGLEHRLLDALRKVR
ncbi:MAG: PilZ domain-containing protein [Bradymonadia bacterium]|jgi:hypothetical protein